MGALSRAGTAADAIQGLLPRVVYSPQSQEDAVEVMRLCAAERMTVAFAGGRTAMGLGAPPRKLDAVIDTRGMKRILEYAPSDMVLVAEAGTTLAAAQDLVRKEGQQLSLDPPLAERATLGGVVAANSFGPRRAKFGSARDVIIGVGLIRADGVLAHGGGKVVKNVAGFDLPKMACGSLGTLALLSTVSFRLHPLPERGEVLLVRGRSAAQVVALVAELSKRQFEPAAVVALGNDHSFDVAVAFEGFAAGVDQQVRRLVSLCAEAGASADKLNEADARALGGRHDAVRTGGPLRVKLSAPLSQLQRVQESAFDPLCAALRSARTAWYASLGLGFVAGEVNDAAAAASAVQRARAAVLSLGGSLVLEEASPEVRAAVDVWGPPPAAFSIMQALKERFDPEGRLAPGRFVGGI